MDEQITHYPHLRAVLDPSFGEMSDAELEDAFAVTFGELSTPAGYEEFLGGFGRALSSAARDVGQFAQRAAPVAATALQGAGQGAAAGSMLGPYGAIGGAILGGTSAALSRHGTGAARRVGHATSGVVGTASSLTGRGGAVAGLQGTRSGVAGGRGAGAAAQLLSLLQQPEVHQALQQLAGGRNGAVSVADSRLTAPASAFAGLLGALAREAEAQGFDGDEHLPSYLLDAEGALLVDPADPDQRAARLLQLLVAGEQEEGFDDADAAGFDEAEEYESFDDADAAFNEQLQAILGDDFAHVDLGV
jgi:hypothetical protein